MRRHSDKNIRKAVWSTPRNPTTHAKRIRETVQRCLHETDA